MERAQTQLNLSPEYVVSGSWRTSGLFAWLLILLLVVICLLPYFLVKHFFSSVVVYGTVFVVPLCLAAYFRGIRGTLITSGAIVMPYRVLVLALFPC